MADVSGQVCLIAYVWGSEGGDYPKRQPSDRCNRTKNLAYANKTIRLVIPWDGLSRQGTFFYGWALSDRQYVWTWSLYIHDYRADILELVWRKRSSWLLILVSVWYVAVYMLQSFRWVARWREIWPKYSFRLANFPKRFMFCCCSTFTIRVFSYVSPLLLIWLYGDLEDLLLLFFCT